MERLIKGFVILLIALSLSGCYAMTGKSAGENIDDASITASVKSQLVADKVSNLVRVDVDTNRGIVYLNGTVDTPAQKARAEELARRVRGVSNVVNNLQITRG